MDALFQAGLTLSLIDRMTRPLARAQDELNRTEQQAMQLSERLDNIGQGMSQAGQSMAMAGGAMTAAFAAPVKFAADFESSMADVNKLAEFTDKQYQQFSSTLLEMSERIPMSAAELSELAAAGARMGLPNEELTQFTEMVSKLGVAVEMPAGKIGDLMAKLSNQFDLSIDKTKLLGDAINYLGDNTEAAVPGIIDAMRKFGPIAGSMNIAADQASALSASMVALGFQNEEAGTALANTFSRLSTITTQSKDAQKAFSELGFNASRFAKRMRDDPVPAFMEFLEKAKETGKANEYLNRIIGQESGRKIVGLTNDLKGLKDTLGLVADESTYAGSAQKEFQNRVDTFNSQMQLLWNTTKNLGIVLGSMFLEPLTAVAKVLKAVIGPLSNFAEQHKILSSVIFGTIGAIGMFTLAAGGLLMFLGFIAQGLSGILALQGQGLFTAMVGPLKSVASGLRVATLATWAFLRAQLRNAQVLAGKAVASLARLAVTLYSTVASGFTVATTAAWSFTAALLANPITWVAAAIAGAALLIYKFWGPISSFFTGLWSGIKSAASSAISGVVYAITHPLETIKKLFLNFNPAGWLLQALNKASQRLLGFSLFDAGQKILNSLWKGMKSLASKPVQMITNVAQKIRDFLPFSPAKMGPLTDIHKTGGALMKTMAAGIQPDPVTRKMQGALDSAKKAVPAAAMGASLAVTPVMAGGMPQIQDATAKAQYMAEAPAPPRIPDLSATARWQPQLEGMPRMQYATAKMQTVTDLVTPREYPEITNPERRASAGTAAQEGAVYMTVEDNRTINIGTGDPEAIERILDEDSREAEERVYNATVRALERRRRGDFGG